MHGLRFVGALVKWRDSCEMGSLFLVFLSFASVEATVAGIKERSGAHRRLSDVVVCVCVLRSRVNLGVRG